jgi:hypothetical protein
MSIAYFDNAQDRLTSKKSLKSTQNGSKIFKLCMEQIG